MKLATRTEGIETSYARKLFNKAKEYDNVIDLTLGDPDVSAPLEVKQAGIAAIQNNYAHYSANAGLLEARKAVVNHIGKVWKLENVALEDVVITVGGMGALFLALYSIVDPLDEVIVLSPYYPNYIQAIKSCGGVPKIINSYSSERGLYIDEQELRNNISNKTKAIMINSPNNPTGEIFSEDDLEKVAKIAKENDFLIISDEVYKALLYDNDKHRSILKYPDAIGRTILVDSMSKEFCMTGWRIGFAYGPTEIIQAMIRLQENMVMCAPMPAQYAMIEAYNNEKLDTSYMIEEFQKRRDFLYENISLVNGLKCRKPPATFYLFVDIKATGLKSYEFAIKLLEQAHVAVVPGITYGKDYDDYIRIAFTKDVSVLQEAIKRIDEFIRSQVS